MQFYRRYSIQTIQMSTGFSSFFFFVIQIKKNYMQKWWVLVLAYRKTVSSYFLRQVRLSAWVRKCFFFVCLWNDSNVFFHVLYTQFYECVRARALAVVKRYHLQLHYYFFSSVALFCTIYRKQCISIFYAQTNSWAIVTHLTLKHFSIIFNSSADK